MLNSPCIAGFPQFALHSYTNLFGEYWWYFNLYESIINIYVQIDFLSIVKSKKMYSYFDNNMKRDMFKLIPFQSLEWENVFYKNMYENDCMYETSNITCRDFNLHCKNALWTGTWWILIPLGSHLPMYIRHTPMMPKYNTPPISH